MVNRARTLSPGDEASESRRAGTTVTARFPAERIVYTATKAAGTTSLTSAGSGG